jgi:phosphate transport system substrate-binding protein
LHPQVQIEVRGGDSTVGLGAVTSQQADIGDSDIYANRALYPNPDLTDHIICIIPNAMIVNPAIPVKSLTQQQIIDIFSTGLESSRRAKPAYCACHAGCSIRNA